MNGVDDNCSLDCWEIAVVFINDLHFPYPLRLSKESIAEAFGVPMLESIWNSS